MIRPGSDDDDELPPRVPPMDSDGEDAERPFDEPADGQDDEERPEKGAGQADQALDSVIGLDEFFGDENEDDPLGDGGEPSLEEDAADLVDVLEEPGLSVGSDEPADASEFEDDVGTDDDDQESGPPSHLDDAEGPEEDAGDLEGDDAPGPPRRNALDDDGPFTEDHDNDDAWADET